MLRPLRAGALLAASVGLLLPLTACSAAQSGEDTAWAGALCTATANAYLASTLLANDVPPPEALTNDTLADYQARLGTEVGETSSAVDSVSSQLASVPRSLADDVASLTAPVADLSTAATAAEAPLAAVTGAPTAKAAVAAMPPATEATNATRAASVALVDAVIALGSNPAFSGASTCSLPTPTPLAS